MKRTMRVKNLSPSFIIVTFNDGLYIRGYFMQKGLKVYSRYRNDH